MVKFTKVKIARGDFMKKFKKILPLILSLIVAFCLLTGCNYTINDGNASGGANASTTTNNNNQVVYVNTTVEYTYGSSPRGYAARYGVKNYTAERFGNLRQNYERHQLR